MGRLPALAERPMHTLPEHGGQPYHAWWKQERQHNPYAPAPRGVRGATPRSGSMSSRSRSGSSATATGTGSSRRSSSRRSNSTGSSGQQRAWKRPRAQAQKRPAAAGPPSGSGAKVLQQRVNATLRELEEIKAGTHAVCIPPPRPARATPRLAPGASASSRRYVEPVVTSRRPADGQLALATPTPPSSAPPTRIAAPQPAPAPARAGATLEGLLRAAGLEQYGPTLVQQGFDLPGVLGATAAQLQHAGMKMGHALRLLNAGHRMQANGSASARAVLGPAQAAEAAAGQQQYAGGGAVAGGGLAKRRGRAPMAAPPTTRPGAPASAGADTSTRRSGDGGVAAAKEGEWSEEEEDALLKARAIYGNRWDAIAMLLPGRSKESAKAHWEASLQSTAAVARSSTSASSTVLSSRGGGANPTPTPTPTPTPPPPTPAAPPPAPRHA